MVDSEPVRSRFGSGVHASPHHPHPTPPPSTSSETSRALIGTILRLDIINAPSAVEISFGGEEGYREIRFNDPGSHHLLS